MIEMAYKVFGQGKPIVVIHGLYGMSDNWLPFAKRMQNRYKVYLVDVRNHGLSSHSETHTYEDICSDISLFLKNHNIEKAILMGHSMGGKAAMLFALQNPGKILSLIIVDIAPVNYQSKMYDKRIYNHSDIIKAMLKLEVDKIKNRTEAEVLLNRSVGDIRTTRFLLKNLIKTEEGYKWRLNLKTLQSSLINIVSGFDSKNLEPATLFPVLILKGSNSGFVTFEGEDAIRRYFPLAKIVTIEGAGHWLHAEKPDDFFEAVNAFLKNNLINHI
mgnify:CR=1 FL=1|jgi:esterase